MLKRLMKPATGVVIGCAIGNFVSATPMVNSAFGVFLLPISEEFNWPRSSVSAVLGIVAIVGFLFYPLIGRLADLYGPRKIVLMGNVLFAAALALLYFNNGSLILFYALFALVGLTAAIPSTVLFNKIVAGWFVTSRGAALGLSAGLGNGMGATVMPAVAQAMILEYGWRGAYAGLGLVTLIIGFPLMYALLRDPVTPDGDMAGGISAEDVSHSFSEARKTATFWKILLAIALGAGCMTALFTHVVSMLIDRGYTPGAATQVLVIFALVTVVWQIVIGFLLDRVQTPRLAVPFFLAALAGLILFVSTESFPLLLLAGGLMGIGLGTEYGVLPYFTSRYFGLKAYGVILGTIYGTIVLTLGFTPFLMDTVFDVTGSYDLAVIAIGIALMIGAILLWTLPPYNGLRDGVATEINAT
ncbi:MAG: MFS transporter [Rhizobiales bacterium]|nr:MFS transporter [Hyphomicrobiales bacterium]